MLDELTTTLEHTLEIEAAPATVFAMWTTSEGLTAWWGSNATVDPVPGGEIRVALDDGPVMRGSYVIVDSPHQVVFTFGWEGEPPGGPLPPGSTKVDVRIEPSRSGCVVTLRHSGLPLEHIGSHASGWAHFLAEQRRAAADWGRP